MGRVIYIISVLITSLISASVLADIYKSVDKEGNVTYSDEPVKEEKALTLPILNVIPPPPPRAAEIPVTKAPRSYKIFNVTVPANDTTVPRGQKEITVEIAISPLLRPGHFIALDLNGNRIGEPRKGNRFHIELIYPGTQRLVANIVNKGGTVVQMTPAIIIHNVAPGPLTTTIIREKALDAAKKHKANQEKALSEGDIQKAKIEKALSEANIKKANRYTPKAPQAPQAPQAPRGSQHDQPISNIAP